MKPGKTKTCMTCLYNEKGCHKCNVMKKSRWFPGTCPDWKKKKGSK